MAERSGGLFDVSLTEMLGFEQVPCYDGEQSISNQKFHSFVSRYQIEDHENAISMIYEQFSGSNNDNESETSFGLCDDAASSSLLSPCDSEGLASDSEDDSLTASSYNSSVGASFLSRSRSSSIQSNASEMQTVTQWYGVFVPAENALYLESPSNSALHSDCLTDILDVAECMNCFKVYIGLPRDRLDVVRQFLFAGFEISKKGKEEKQATPAAIVGAQSKNSGAAAAVNNHILLEYEL